MAQNATTDDAQDANYDDLRGLEQGGLVRVDGENYEVAFVEEGTMRSSDGESREFESYRLHDSEGVEVGQVYLFTDSETVRFSFYSRDVGEVEVVEVPDSVDATPEEWVEATSRRVRDLVDDVLNPESIGQEVEVHKAGDVGVTFRPKFEGGMVGREFWSAVDAHGFEVTDINMGSEKILVRDRTKLD